MGVIANWSIMITRALKRIGPRIDLCGRPVSLGCSLEFNCYCYVVLFESSPWAIL